MANQAALKPARLPAESVIAILCVAFLVIIDGSCTSKEKLANIALEHIRITQRRVPSQHPNLRELELVMRSEVTIQPVAFRVECDHEISGGKRPVIVGQTTYRNYATKMSSDRKALMFSFESPALTPDQRLVFSLISADDIRVTNVERIQPLL